MLKLCSMLTLCLVMTGCAVYARPAIVYDNNVHCTLVPVKDQTGVVLYHRKICRRSF